MHALQYRLNKKRKQEALKGGIFIGVILALCAGLFIYGLYTAPDAPAVTVVCEQINGQLTCLAQ